MKNGDIVFNPALSTSSPKKQNAINAIGMGSLEKFFLEFSTRPWPAYVDEYAIFTKDADPEFNNRSISVACMNKVHTGFYLLQVFVHGSHARAIN